MSSMTSLFDLNKSRTNLTMSYVNREQSGTVASTFKKQQKDPIVERIMMIAERLVALEKEVAELKKAKK